MITLDPEMVGNLAPVSKLTTEVTTVNGKPRTDIPYARLPRIDRLRVSGKLDETEENGTGKDDGEDEESKKRTKEEREKRKMRGKGKSMKRYLRKQRKNVIDPAAVRCFTFQSHIWQPISILYTSRSLSVPNLKNKKRRKRGLPLPLPENRARRRNHLPWTVSSVQNRLSVSLAAFSLQSQSITHSWLAIHQRCHKNAQ